MPRIRPARALAARQGVILLVVISLLTLFAMVGLTFVIYAQAEANSMRVARQGETNVYPDADPEMLLNYFLSQLIYDTNTPNSALRNWGLATNIYGLPGGTVPFNGAGRLQGPNFLNVNYAVNQAGNLTTDGVPNPPYTYPDFNCLSLAAVRAADGAVLMPSFCRYIGTTGQLQPLASGAGTPLMRASIVDMNGNTVPPEDGFCDVKNLPLSPGLVNPNNSTVGNPCTPNDSIWMDLGFPVMYSANGQKYKPLFAALIQDLDGRANVNVAGNILASLNGSGLYNALSHQGWSPGEVNLGYAVLTEPFQSPNTNEAANLLLSVPYPSLCRYDSSWQGVASSDRLTKSFAPGGHFYSGVNLDCYPQLAVNPTTPTSGGFALPQANSNWGFPYFGSPYANGWWNIAGNGIPNEGSLNPMLFNFFSPQQSYYGGPSANPIFGISELEALLRYGDTGSPALTSPLMNLCPQSLQQYLNQPSTQSMRLLTTHSFDLSVPGTMPCITSSNTANYQLLSPTNNVPGVPSSPQSPATMQTLKRIDLNRGFVDYPLLPAGSYSFPATATNYMYTSIASTGPTGNNPTTSYAAAIQDRRAMAQEIFDVLCTVTGAACTVVGGGQPITVNGGATTQQLDALRWLAQLAVNIVDFVNFSQAQASQATAPAPDDVMTSFNWNTQQTSSINNGWVFGTVLPRLVINEAYVEIDNNPSELLNQMPKPYATMPYDVNCWVELHNPFASDVTTGQAGFNRGVPTPFQGTAQLYVPAANGNPAYAAYRVILAQNADGGTTQAQNMAANNNVLGMPNNIMTVVDKYDAGTITGTFPPPSGGSGTKANNQTAALSGTPTSLYQVLPNYQTGSPGSMQNGQAGQNKGFYVLGSSLAPFPGTASNTTAFATLPVKEEAPSQYSTGSSPGDPTLQPNLSTNATQFTTVGNSMHYQYPSSTALAKGTTLNIGNLGHTVALQRLACPYLPPQPVPTNPNFNPYVTVDYILNVPTQMGVIYDAASTNLTPNYTTSVTNWNSVGRNQPYAADGSQLVPQQGTTNKYQPYTNLAGGSSPQNTFFCPNAQGTAAFAYDWLFHANRPLVSPLELLQVSGYKPHQLTQMFMLANANQVWQPPAPANPTGPPATLGKFQHRAPWITQSQLPNANPSSSPLIYRALEFFEAGLRPQWSPIGGRVPGKININTIYDASTWVALCDPQPNNFFTSAGVNPALFSAWQFQSQYARTPSLVPTPTDVPFVGMAAPFASATAGQQYPVIGSGIQNTLLRPDPSAPAATNPLKLLLEPSMSSGQLLTQAENPSALAAGTQVGHPYLRMELLNKIFNSLTTRSNVFAVWLTVGFFEVPPLNDVIPTNSYSVWPEINKAEGRNIRHRMFAIIDRTNLTIAGNATQVGPPQVLPAIQAANPTVGIYFGQYTPGPRPFFINSLSSVPLSQVGSAATVTLPANGIYYEDASWSISIGMPLVIDSGPYQEVVMVTGVSGNTFTATFTKPHPIGFAVSGACNWNSNNPPPYVPILGNPGPQPFFDMRNPMYSGVVRYFSIIQ